LRRRDFIKVLGGAATWPLTVNAEQPAIPRVGWIWGGRSVGNPSELRGFKQGLRELGYVEGTNIFIEYRFGEESAERLPQLAADLARLKPDVILAVGTGAAREAQRAAPTASIIFMSGDPIGTGLVSSLNRPTGNLTGVSLMILSEKWPDLAREILPGVNRIGYLWNPSDISSTGSFNQARRSAEGLGIFFGSYPIERPSDLEDAFTTMVKDGIAMVLLDHAHPYPTNWPLVSQLALKYKLPSISEVRDFVVAGGLISYGASLFDITRRMAYYMERVLKGTKPADLPVEQPTKFELVINLKTAKALGLAVPPTLLSRADEVIE